MITSDLAPIIFLTDQNLAAIGKIAPDPMRYFLRFTKAGASTHKISNKTFAAFIDVTVP